jgi:heme-degrading monooxygenase HmoA
MNDFIVQIALTVRPENQQAVIDIIRTAGDPSRVPGLRSVTLLRSLDGTRVVNQLRWADRAAFESARAGLPLIAEIRAAVQRLTGGATTDSYEVVEVG